MGKNQSPSDIKANIDQLIYAYRRSSILFSAYETGILPYLADHETSVNYLARRLSLSAEGTERIVSALAAMGLLNKSKDKFRLKSCYRPLFSESSDESIGGQIVHEMYLQKRWLRLSESIRNGKPVKKKEEGQKPENRKRFITAMSTVGQKSAQNVIDNIHFRGDENLLDLAGGPGIYLKKFCETYPQMKVTLMDLPDTIKVARKYLARHPAYKRMNFISGDIFHEKIGDSYDVIFISNVIHIFSLEDIEVIFKKCYTLLKKGGRILVKDFYLNPEETGPEFSTIFSLHMLLSTEGGRCYKVSEIRDLLRSSGFYKGKTIKIPENSLVIEGIKSKNRNV